MIIIQNHPVVKVLLRYKLDIFGYISWSVSLFRSMVGGEGPVRKLCAAG
jgi:hypothetical protein